VSRYYTYDWQFAATVGHLTLLRSAALVIAIMPIILELSRGAFGVSWPVPLSLWLTWLSSIFYLFCWLILYIRCPSFIKQYGNFGDYSKRQHSHRWILWELYNSRCVITALPDVISETIQKGIAKYAYEKDDDCIFAACPLFKQNSVAQNFAIFPPVNMNRDLYIPVVLDRQRVVLSLQERDPELPNKEKELFWIILTRLTKERIRSRVAFWALAHISGIAFICSIFWNAGRAICRIFANGTV